MPSREDRQQGKVQFSHYDIRLSIDPEKQFVRVAGTLKLLVREQSPEKISFKLHKNLVIDSFSINGHKAYHIEREPNNPRWTPDAIKLHFPNTGGFKKGDVLDVEFAYHGTIDSWPEWSGNVIGRDWVEMGSYFPWYPTTKGKFTYRLSVDIDPEYTVYAAGVPSLNGDLQEFESDTPFSDLVVCAAKNLDVRESKLSGQRFTLVNASLSEASVDLILQDIASVYQLYQHWYGDIEPQNMSVVISGREKGGGYARKSALYLGGLTDASYAAQSVDYVQYIAHEIAHFWWRNAKADSWHDWLNESFAEYSALKVIQQLEGSEAFIARLAKKREESAKAPVLWGMSRTDPGAYTALYSKGVVLLNELESRLGEAEFLALCQQRLKKNINTTEDFLQLLKKNAGAEDAVWFENLLKSD